MECAAKILLLGKTKAGKSSFINYFLGKNVAKAGPGAPITSEYFVPYEASGGKYPLYTTTQKAWKPWTPITNWRKLLLELKNKIVAMTSTIGSTPYFIVSPSPNGSSSSKPIFCSAYGKNSHSMSTLFSPIVTPALRKRFNICAKGF